tara:strand:- start:14601 stop:15275 length:675 start_codon:yes stop_codon:yes gene_type:complete
MNIAILGNGKMGKQISKLAKKKGHTITCTADSKNPITSLDIRNAEVAIEFSTPASAFQNIAHAINNGIPVVSGTTGWLDRLEEITDLCIKKNGAFIYASNFSLGVNMFFELNKKLANLMQNQDYETKIHEIHHTQKIDAPSGTAITLQKEIGNILNNQPPISSERVKNVSGVHQITYSSIIDEIKIRHTAHNRDGFAIGAIIAAEWIINKNGIYSMQDVLKNKI